MDRWLRTWALKQPESNAIECGPIRWTYRELERRVGNLAEHLLRSGLEHGARIGLLMPHGPQMVVAMIATIRAGMTFVPVDPLWPDRRAREILAAVAPSLIIIDASLTDGSTPHDIAPQLIWDDCGKGQARTMGTADASDVPAYILFTSGSTGRAKGVIQSRAATVAHAENYAASIALSPADRLSALAPYTFDAALMDIFGAIVAGATLCIHDPRAAGVVNLASRLASEGVTVCHQTPTLFRAMLAGLKDAVTWPSLRHVVLGGEPVFAADIALARRCLPRNVTLINGYGPTECTMAAQQAIDPSCHSTANLVPIGLPVPGVEIVLRGADGTPVVGEGSGEIVLRSDHVALGYWPPQSAKQSAFAIDADRVRTYATGDLAARRRDGRLVHLGRVDDQVKILGHRIEPAEVEAHLSAVAGIRQGAIIVRNTLAGPCLAAWYVPDDRGRPTAQEVRSALQARLPAYMIPFTIAPVPAIPLLPNGKIDRQALADGFSSLPGALPGDAGLGDILSEIWRRTLGRADIDPDASFFALGGDSLQAITVQIEAGAALGMPIPSLFDFPTIAAMVRHQGEAGQPGTIAQADTPTSAPLSPPQRRYWERMAGLGDQAALHVGLVFEIEGQVDFDALARALAIVAEQNDVLRIGIEPRDTGPWQVAATVMKPLLRRGRNPAGPIRKAAWDRMLDQLALHATGARFVMAEPGLLRAQFLSRTPRSHALVLSFHHLVLDAWGRSLLEIALFREYERQLAGLPPESDRRPSYLRSTLNMLARPKRGEVSHPILRRLATLGDPAICLPHDDAIQSSTSSSSTDWTLAEAEYEAIGHCARAHHSTPFSVIATLFAIALAGWTGERRIVATFDRANRHGDDWDVVGLFSDVAPLIVDIDPASPFDAMLRSVHREIAAAQSVDMPFFADMVEQRWPGGLRRYDKIFPVAMAMESDEGWCQRSGNLTVRRREVGSGHLSRDLLMLATQHGGKLTISLLYRSGRLRPRTIARLMSELKAAFGQMPLSTAATRDAEAACSPDNKKRRHPGLVRELSDSSASSCRSSDFLQLSLDQGPFPEGEQPSQIESSRSRARFADEP